MTSTIGTKVNKASRDFVSQRSRIWEKYDEARQQEAELNQYAGQFGGSNSSQSLPYLSSSKAPPDELSRLSLISKTSKIAESQSEQGVKPSIYPAFILATLLSCSSLAIKARSRENQASEISGSGIPR
jgi:hypothetical protein